MKNLLQRLFLAGTIGLAGLGLSGCDKNENISLSSGKIDNVEVRFIRVNKSGYMDEYAIEIYDSKNKIRTKLKQLGLPNGFIQYDDRMVELRGGEFIDIPVPDYKAEK